MKKGTQKLKSNNQEREVGAAFTQAYYPHGDGVIRRTPGSGGFDKRITPGDLMALKYMDYAKEDMTIDKSFPFLIECKFWDRVHVNHLFWGLFGAESVMYDWMRQAIDDSILTKQIPIVVFKLWKENCVMMRRKDFFQLKMLFGEFDKKSYSVERIDKIKKDDLDPKISLFFCLLKDFIEWIDWDVYKLAQTTIRIRSLVPKGG